jgi:hypothetical protein
MPRPVILARSGRTTATAFSIWARSSPVRQSRSPFIRPISRTPGNADQLAGRAHTRFWSRTKARRRTLLFLVNLAASTTPSRIRQEP